MSKHYYEVGALYRGDFRRILKQFSFEMDDFSWEEDRSFIDSRFYVKGSYEAIIKLNNICNEWSK